jgi:hypothetical protein
MESGVDNNQAFEKVIKYSKLWLTATSDVLWFWAIMCIIHLVAFEFNTHYLKATLFVTFYASVNSGTANTLSCENRTSIRFAKAIFILDTIKFLSLLCQFSDYNYVVLFQKGTAFYTLFQIPSIMLLWCLYKADRVRKASIQDQSE